MRHHKSSEVIDVENMTRLSHQRITAGGIHFNRRRIGIYKERNESIKYTKKRNILERKNMSNSSKYMIAAMCAMTMAFEASAVQNPFLIGKKTALNIPKAPVAAAPVQSAVKEDPKAQPAVSLPKALAQTAKPTIVAKNTVKENPKAESRVSTPTPKPAVTAPLAAALAKTTINGTTKTKPAVSAPAPKAAVSTSTPTASVNNQSQDGRNSRMAQFRQKRMA